MHNLGKRSLITLGKGQQGAQESSSYIRWNASGMPKMNHCFLKTFLHQMCEVASEFILFPLLLFSGSKVPNHLKKHDITKSWLSLVEYSVVFLFVGWSLKTSSGWWSHKSAASFPYSSSVKCKTISLALWGFFCFTCVQHFQCSSYWVHF